MSCFVNDLNTKDNSQTTADNKEISEVMRPGDFFYSALTSISKPMLLSRA